MMIIQVQIPWSRPNIAEYIEESRPQTQPQNVTLAEDTPTQDVAEEVSGACNEDEEDDNNNDEELIESGAEASSGTESSVDDSEELIERLTDVLEKVKIKVINNIDKDEVKKSTKSLIKNFEKAVNGNTQTFSRILFSVGKEATAPAKSGAKRKNRGLIPVQQTAKSRRVHKHRGSQPATGGRKVKDLEHRVQFIVDSNKDDFIQYHSLPKQKKQQPKQAHSLNASVKANKAGTKKH